MDNWKGKQMGGKENRLIVSNFLESLTEMIVKNFKKRETNV